MDEYLARHREERDESGRAMVVRNGKARPRTAAFGGGAVPVTGLRVNDRREGHSFTSTILPPYMRLEEALPVMYLRGMSASDFAPALEVLFGESVRGFL